MIRLQLNRAISYIPNFFAVSGIKSQQLLTFFKRAIVNTYVASILEIYSYASGERDSNFTTESIFAWTFDSDNGISRTVHEHDFGR